MDTLSIVLKLILLNRRHHRFHTPLNLSPRIRITVELLAPDLSKPNSTSYTFCDNGRSLLRGRNGVGIISGRIGVGVGGQVWAGMGYRRIVRSTGGGVVR